VDYWRYDFKDMVVKENYQQLITADFNCEDDPASCSSKIERDANGSVQRVDTEFINAPSVITDGLDFNVIYRTDFDGEAGDFSFAGGGTYVLSYAIQVAKGTPIIEGAGNRNFDNPARSMPQLRMNFPLAWHLDAHGAGIIVHFISGYDNDESIDESELREPPAPIDAWVTIDLQYSFRLDEGDRLATTFKVGVLNVLGSDPPALDAGYGYDVFVHDPRGRIIYGRLIQEF